MFRKHHLHFFLNMYCKATASQLFIENNKEQSPITSPYKNRKKKEDRNTYKVTTQAGQRKTLPKEG